MQKYIDIDNDSGVDSYEINLTSITIKFEETAKLYTYSYASAGQPHIEHMKRLAASGDRLNSYINHNVKSHFVR